MACARSTRIRQRFFFVSFAAAFAGSRTHLVARFCRPRSPPIPQALFLARSLVPARGHRSILNRAVNRSSSEQSRAAAAASSSPEQLQDLHYRPFLVLVALGILIRMILMLTYFPAILLHSDSARYARVGGWSIYGDFWMPAGCFWGCCARYLVSSGSQFGSSTFWDWGPALFCICRCAGWVAVFAVGAGSGDGGAGLGADAVLARSKR